MTAPERLRAHPKGRLASLVQIMGLASVAEQLRAELHDSVDGHRQIAIVRHGPVTMILFVFDAGGSLKEHRAEGVVTMQVIAGHVQITADGEVLEARTGELVALATDVRHSVRAVVASEMLLTMHRVTGAAVATVAAAASGAGATADAA